MTIAEREVAYNGARSEIFVNFQEKGKVKEKDLNTSLTSGSVTSSVGEISSTGDLDASLSSPATESKYSEPPVRDRKDGRRSNGSPSRRMRSSALIYGSNDSRGSRLPYPPSVRYSCLYEPSLAATPCDQSHHPLMNASAYSSTITQALPPLLCALSVPTPSGTHTY
ncbi:hypothetical protein EDD17DRAFT_512239 [Pisolithus thermaeus]|nr:hypothetical protein EDD17DRAFT_512239 [Pisolithus thermaeus]